MQTTYESENGMLSETLRKQLNLLMTTPTGTVALDRDFGVDMSFLDLPTPATQSQFAAELSVKIEKYIPQLKLKEVKLLSADMQGHSNVKVVVTNVE